MSMSQLTTRKVKKDITTNNTTAPKHVYKYIIRERTFNFKYAKHITTPVN